MRSIARPSATYSRRGFATDGCLDCLRGPRTSLDAMLEASLRRLSIATRRARSQYGTFGPRDHSNNDRDSQKNIDRSPACIFTKPTLPRRRTPAWSIRPGRGLLPPRREWIWEHGHTMIPAPAPSREAQASLRDVGGILCDFDACRDTRLGVAGT